MFPVLHRESTISDLFYHFSPLVGYGLLKYVIDEFGSNTLKIFVVSYSDDILACICKEDNCQTANERLAWTTKTSSKFFKATSKD